MRIKPLELAFFVQRTMVYQCGTSIYIWMMEKPTLCHLQVTGVIILFLLNISWAQLPLNVSSNWSWTRVARWITAINLRLGSESCMSMDEKPCRPWNGMDCLDDKTSSSFIWHVSLSSWQGLSPFSWRWELQVPKKTTVKKQTPKTTPWEKSGKADSLKCISPSSCRASAHEMDHQAKTLWGIQGKKCTAPEQWPVHPGYLV